MTTIDPATAEMLRRAGIAPQAWERFAAAENASLRRDHEARTAARRGRPPTTATLGQISAAVRTKRLAAKPTLAEFAAEFWAGRSRKVAA